MTSPNADKKTGKPAVAGRSPPKLKLAEASYGRRRPERCPICAKSAVAEYAPFCSKRCADIDLHRWLSGSYAIPAVDDESDGEENSGDDA